MIDSSYPFHLTSWDCGRVLRGLLRRIWGLIPPFSPETSPSAIEACPSACFSWSSGRGLRGVNRLRKRRLLGAYRLPLTETPPGPVTLAASEPWWEQVLMGHVKKKKSAHQTWDAHFWEYIIFFNLSCFNHIEFNYFTISDTAEKFSWIVLLNGSLKRNQQWNKYVQQFRLRFDFFFKPPSSHSSVFFLPDVQTHLLWYHSCNEQNSIIQPDSWIECKRWSTGDYLFMKPYPFRTLNHFTVPWTKVAGKKEKRERNTFFFLKVNVWYQLQHKKERKEIMLYEYWKKTLCVNH